MNHMNHGGIMGYCWVIMWMYWIYWGRDADRGVLWRSNGFTNQSIIIGITTTPSCNFT